MGINRFYGELKYYELTQTDTDTGFTNVYSNPVTFQGVINQNTSVQRDIAGQLGQQANYKLFSELTSFPTGCVISDGTNSYRIVSDENRPKDTIKPFLNNNINRHIRVLLESVNDEKITLVD